MRTVRRTPKIKSDEVVGTTRAASLNESERALLFGVMRTCTGAGPYPEAANLPFFKLHYVLACLKKRAGAIKVEHRNTLRSVERKLQRTSPSMSDAVREAVEDVKTALAKSLSEDERKNLYGRWELIERGVVFVVKSLTDDSARLYYPANSNTCDIPITDLASLLRDKKLRYLGR